MTGSAQPPITITREMLAAATKDSRGLQTGRHGPAWKPGGLSPAAPLIFQAPKDTVLSMALSNHLSGACLLPQRDSSSSAPPIGYIVARATRGTLARNPSAILIDPEINTQIIQQEGSYGNAPIYFRIEYASDLAYLMTFNSLQGWAVYPGRKVFGHYVVAAPPRPRSASPRRDKS